MIQISNQKTIIFLIIILFSVLSMTCYSCKSQSTSINSQEKKIEKEKKKRQKDDTILYQKAVKQQMNNQTPETREAMKDAQNKPKEIVKIKEFFIKRWIKIGNINSNINHLN